MRELRLTAVWLVIDRIKAVLRFQIGEVLNALVCVGAMKKIDGRKALIPRVSAWECSIFSYISRRKPG
jgi:hypothetical protein